MKIVVVLSCLVVLVVEVKGRDPCRCEQGYEKPTEMPPECWGPEDCLDPNAVCDAGMCVCKPGFDDTTGVCSGECESDCAGLANGDYQSCMGCDVFLTCSNGIATDNRPCPGGLFWDDNTKTCESTSATCFEPSDAGDLNPTK